MTQDEGARRVLVLGAGKPDMRPETHVLAGPWCLAGLPALMPPQQRFALPPDLLDAPEALDTAAAQARNLVARLAPRMGARCNAERGLRLPESFWDFFLAPWLCRAVETLVDRLYRVESLFRCFRDEELRVSLLPAAATTRFADSNAFMRRGVLDPDWNHWLLSRLLERRLPEAWQAVQAEQAAGPGQSATMETSPKNVKALLREVLRKAAFRLPFPPVKGFSARQSLGLSLALALNRNTRDNTIPLREMTEDAPELPLGFSLEHAEELLLAMLPESVARAQLPATARKALIRARVASVAACEDDAYRLRLALARAGGCRMAFIQHGGDYGYVRSSVAFSLTEYSQHAFFSWGWTRHGDLPGNVVPLPHSQLARLRGAHRETAPTLIFVGTEMLLFPYTLKSSLRPDRLFAYREDKAAFLGDLPPDLRKRTLYRPYFDVPGSLSDAPWLLERFPDVRRCTGALEPHLLGCRLLVLDHLGTTLAQALSAGIPTLLFWNPATCRYTPEAEKLLDELRRAGIVHDTPQSAAAQAARIWDNPRAWWRAEPLASARAAWSRLYALTVPGDETPLWRKALRNL